MNNNINETFTSIMAHKALFKVRLNDYDHLLIEIYDDGELTIRTNTITIVNQYQLYFNQMDNNYEITTHLERVLCPIIIDKIKELLNKMRLENKD